MSSSSAIAQQNGNGAPNSQHPIRSILDTDLYKLTMQQAVLRHYPQTQVAYKFTNRSSATMKFTRDAVKQVQSLVRDLEKLRLTKEERQWLEKECPYLRKEYLNFLEGFRFRPEEEVQIRFVPITKSHDNHISREGNGSQNGGVSEAVVSAEEWGDLEVTVQGRWVDVIFYEVPLMAIISEVYFTHVDRDWSMQGQFCLAMDKAKTLTSNGIRYSEFGTRRRRSYATHKLVIEGLVAGDAAARASFVSSSSGGGGGGALAATQAQSGDPGKLLGTSNVHFAQLYDLVPIGTVAHEWTMAVAALEGYTHSNLKALELWDAVYSPPDFVPNSPTHDLTIALTDTFSTAVFWKDLLSSEKGVEIARRWRGLRQDSGDSKDFAQRAKQEYESIGVDPKIKVVIYSDGLNVERCLDLASYSAQIGIGAGFGIGTYLTNDFVRLSTAQSSPSPSSNDEDVATSKPLKGQVSKPLNIVVKLDQVEGRPVVKISDDLTKNTGNPDEVKAVKRRFGLLDPTSKELSVEDA